MPDLFKASEALSEINSRRENELLLLCSRTEVDEGRAARIRQLAADELDWGYALRLAERHSVAPIFYRRLEEHAKDFVPSAIREQLRGKFRANATRNLLLAGELARIARLFRREGVPLLAYKGPALAVSYYGDLSLRRFIDLDIIVRPCDVRKASGLLRSLGFELPEGLSENRMSLLLRGQHNVAFTSDGGRMIVELHWGVSSSRFADLSLESGVWERATTFELCGESVKCPSPEDTLLALCVHGTKHLWERLAWVCDVSRLLQQKTGLDWAYLSRASADSRTERMLRLGVCLAAVLFGADGLTEPFAEKIHEDPAVPGLSEDVLRRLFDGPEYSPASFIGNLAFNLRARSRLREKLRYFRFVFTPTDADLLALNLPEGLSFGYFILRPFRLLLKGGAEH